MRISSSFSKYRTQLLADLKFVGSIACLLLVISCGNAESSSKSTTYKKPVYEKSDTPTDVVTTNDFEEGKKLFQAEDFENAEKSLRKAISENIDGKVASELYFWLGHTLYSQDKFKEAKNAFMISKNEEAAKMVSLADKAIKE